MASKWVKGGADPMGKSDDEVPSYRPCINMKRETDSDRERKERLPKAPNAQGGNGKLGGGGRGVVGIPCV